VTYNSLVTACAGSVHWDAALALCREAEANGSVRLDAVTYCALIDGCTRAGRWEAALEVSLSRTRPPQAMQKLRIGLVSVSGGRSLTRPFRDARRIPSTRW
jgi:hypothetical protein